MHLNIDEIDEFFKMPPESFAVDSIHWWAGQCAQFSNLSQLAWDTLSIPGVF
jgi:hAT family C-terminal dimerisation region